MEMNNRYLEPNQTFVHEYILLFLIVFYHLLLLFYQGLYLWRSQARLLGKGVLLVFRVCGQPVKKSIAKGISFAEHVSLNMPPLITEQVATLRST